MGSHSRGVITTGDRGGIEGGHPSHGRAAVRGTRGLVAIDQSPAPILTGSPVTV
jgi:hypothetical protein